MSLDLFTQDIVIWKINSEHSPNENHIILTYYKNGHHVPRFFSDRMFEGKVTTQFDEYIKNEQVNTVIDLTERVHSLKHLCTTDIIIDIDGKIFNNEDYKVIQQLSRIIESQGVVGKFGLGNLKISINRLATYTDKLIKL